MERFAIKIDKSLRSNLYRICRLCGIDNPGKVKILDKNANLDDGEPDLWKKILDCIGFEICKDDKMPQSMCGICVDKINDFYEFREMCFATNVQTRMLLGLKDEPPKLRVKKLANQETCKKENDIKDVLPVPAANIPAVVGPGKRGRKRRNADSTLIAAASKTIKTDENEVKIEDSAPVMPSRKKLKFGVAQKAMPVPLTLKKQKAMTLLQKKLANRAAKVKSSQHLKIKPKEEIKEETTLSTSASGSSKSTVATATPKTEPESSAAAPIPSFRYKHKCAVCKQGFPNKIELENHLESTHVPTILRYHCVSCNETLKKSTEIKNHNLWHKLSKTPFQCGRCNDGFISVYTFSKHLRDCHVTDVPSTHLVLDRECPQCRETFVTNFLYNVHPCSINTKKCAGCDRMLKTKDEFLRHSALCPKTTRCVSQHIPAAAAADAAVRIKNENDVEAAADATSVDTVTAPKTTSKSSKDEESLKLPSLIGSPVVSLARLSAPTMNANQCVIIPANVNINKEVQTPQSPSALAGQGKGKKGIKRGVTKKDLKRFDELLKSTMTTLVSIKHEPSVEDQAEPAVSAITDITTVNVDEVTEPSEGQSRPSSPNAMSVDDFHHGDNSDDNVADAATVSDAAATTIKQEIIDEGYRDLYNNIEVNIKREIVINPAVKSQTQMVSPPAVKSQTQIVNTGSDVNAASTVIASPSRVPVLKLKITKEHGTLNSTLVDDTPKSDKKKKKKKRKDAAEKERDKYPESFVENVTNHVAFDDDSAATTSMRQVTPSSETESTMIIAMPIPGIIRIKQERINEDDKEHVDLSQSHTQEQVIESFDIDEPMPEEGETFAPSHPLVGLQISFVSGGVDFSSEGELEVEHESDSSAQPKEIERQLHQELMSTELEPLDIKPTRAELDSLLQIASVSGGFEMPISVTNGQEEESNHFANNLVDSVQIESLHKKRNIRTAAISQKNRVAKSSVATYRKVKETTQMQTKKLTSQYNSVCRRNEAALLEEEVTTTDFVIKKEKIDPGYVDVTQFNMLAANDKEEEISLQCGENEHNGIDETDKEDTPTNTTASSSTLTSKEDEERAYIANIDFNNLYIKQEIEFSVEAFNHDSVNMLNGSTREALSNEEEDEDSLSSIDEDDESCEEEMEEDEEPVKEYRELEMPSDDDEQMDEQSKAVVDAKSGENNSLQARFEGVPEEKDIEYSEKPITLENIDIKADMIPTLTTSGSLVTSNTDFEIQNAEQISEGIHSEIIQPVSEENQATFEVPQTSNVIQHEFPKISAVFDRTSFHHLHGTLTEEEVTSTSLEIHNNKIVAQVTETNPKFFSSILLETSPPVITPIVAPTIIDAAVTLDGKTVDFPTTIETEYQRISDQPAQSFHGLIIEPASVCSLAQPFFDTDRNSAHLPSQSQTITSNNDDVEELQNNLNQEVALNRDENNTQRISQATQDSITQDISTTSNAFDHSLPSTSSSGTAAALRFSEEIENLLNEGTDAATKFQTNDMVRHQAAVTTSQQTATNYAADNINEIAENNNNANIERELQDESGGGGGYEVTLGEVLPTEENPDELFVQNPEDVPPESSELV